MRIFAPQRLSGEQLKEQLRRIEEHISKEQITSFDFSPQSRNDAKDPYVTANDVNYPLRIFAPQRLRGDEWKEQLRNIETHTHRRGIEIPSNKSFMNGDDYSSSFSPQRRNDAKER